MEILMPQCIELPRRTPTPVESVSQNPQSIVAPPAGGKSIDLLTALRSSASRDSTPKELHGRLNDLLEVLGAYLEEVLRVTARSSAKDPNRAKINFRGAANWMLGGGSLETGPAADLFKRLLDDLERNELLTERLREALAEARDKRPPGKRGAS